MKILKPSVHIEGNINGMELLKAIERAGRTCYKSEDRITEDSALKFVRNLINRGHEAMIEHASFTARFIVDRGVLAEMTRHRLSSYAVESTRFCNYSQNKFGGQIQVIDLATGFQYDLTKETDRLKYECWLRAMNHAEAHYFEMIELGATPQEARSVLPQSTKTEIVMTCNLREWKTIFSLRCAPNCHPQMTEVMLPLLEEAHSLIPVIFDDLYDQYIRPTESATASSTSTFPPFVPPPELSIASFVESGGFKVKCHYK